MLLRILDTRSEVTSKPKVFSQTYTQSDKKKGLKHTFEQKQRSKTICIWSGDIEIFVQKKCPTEKKTAYSNSRNTLCVLCCATVNPLQNVLFYINFQVTELADQPNLIQGGNVSR